MCKSFMLALKDILCTYLTVDRLIKACCALIFFCDQVEREMPPRTEESSSSAKIANRKELL